MAERIELPVSAQKHLKEIDAQIMNLKYQAEQFLDGVIIGMGIDLQKNNVKVNFQEMTIDVTPIEDIEKIVSQIETQVEGQE